MEASYFTILYCFCHTSTWIRHGCARAPPPEPPSHRQARRMLHRLSCLFVCFFHFFSWVLSQNSFIIQLMFFLFWPHHTACGILDPPPGHWTRGACSGSTEAQALVCQGGPCAAVLHMSPPFWTSFSSPSLPLCNNFKTLSITFENYYRVCAYFSPFQLSALFLWASFMW